MQIEAILKTKKSNRPKKRKANEEVLDSFADDEVARLREAMNAAADEDIRCNTEKLPATSKLRLLPEAMETLRKYVFTRFLSASGTDTLFQSLPRPVNGRQQPPRCRQTLARTSSRPLSSGTQHSARILPHP